MYPQPSEVAGLGDGGQAAIDLAIAAIGNYICPGVPDILESASRSVTLYLEDAYPVPPYVPLMGRYRLSASLLGYWPITALTSVTVAGEDVTGECFFDRFAVYRRQSAAPFPVGREIGLEFKTGWEELPSDLYQATLQLAYLYAQNPAGVEMEKIGDVTVRYGKVATSGNNAGTIPSAITELPPGIARLLDPYRLTDH